MGADMALKDTVVHVETDKEDMRNWPYIDDSS
jgi:hypothetical protein